MKRKKKKKSFVILILLLAVIACAVIFGIKMKEKIAEEKRIAEIKKGWYVEITNEHINVRDNPRTYATKIGEVFKGEVYSVIEMSSKDPSNFWYKVEYIPGKEGWIASGGNNQYLTDYNNETDYATPTIKYFQNVYEVFSINDINYKHLEVWDDKEGYKVTHKVYHEVVNDAYPPIDQYWIEYTVTDAAGKSSSKTQKIEFSIAPDENLVLDFAKYYKK